MTPPDASTDRDDDLQRRMQAAGIEEADLMEKFVKGSGPGGQKINKTASCVYLKHLPSGLEVKCQEDRSLASNREEARRRLCLLFEQEAARKRQAENQRRARVRFQKRRRSPTQKKKLVETKRQHGRKKRLRGKPSSDD